MIYAFIVRERAHVGNKCCVCFALANIHTHTTRTACAEHTHTHTHTQLACDRAYYAKHGAQHTHNTLRILHIVRTSACCTFVCSARLCIAHTHTHSIQACVPHSCKYVRTMALQWSPHAHTHTHTLLACGKQTTAQITVCRVCVLASLWHSPPLIRAGF